MKETILIMMVGLPRSGKSTKALQLSAEFNAPIVNPDSIRLALHGQAYAPEAEDFVWATAKVMVRALIKAGHSTVILDATNMSKKRRDFWDSVGAKRVFHMMDATPATCKTRALLTGRPELVPVIDRMVQSYEEISEDEGSVFTYNESGDEI